MRKGKSCTLATISGLRWTAFDTILGIVFCLLFLFEEIVTQIPKFILGDQLLDNDLDWVRSTINLVIIVLAVVWIIKRLRDLRKQRICMASHHEAPTMREEK